jgi:ABC-type multidrug transport system ATPase subunit
MSNNGIILENLSKSFGRHVALDACSLSIEPGSIFGLIGLNGAGKTTLIRVLAGLLRPDTGSISVLGCAPWAHEERMYRRLGIVLENDGFSGNLDFLDNLKLFAAAKDLAWPQVDAYLQEFWADTFIGAESRRPSKKVKYFSRGQRMQCGICRAFLGWPDLYLFDEPTVALDVEAYDHFCGMVRKARNRNSAIVISSHQLSFIEELCDSIGILNNKKLHMMETGTVGPAAGPAQEWMIATESGERFKEIMEKFCGKAVSFSDDAWHFFIEKPHENIPDLVSALCAAGCRVREVRPEKRELRDKIRTHYEKS